MNLSVESIVTGPFQENSYFFWHNDSFDTILIDPGDDEDLISKALDKKNLVVASSNYLGEEIISLIKEYV